MTDFLTRKEADTAVISGELYLDVEEFKKTGHFAFISRAKGQVSKQYEYIQAGLHLLNPIFYDRGDLIKPDSFERFISKEFLGMRARFGHNERLRNREKNNLDETYEPIFLLKNKTTKTRRLSTPFYLAYGQALYQLFPEGYRVKPYKPRFKPSQFIIT